LTPNRSHFNGAAFFQSGKCDARAVRLDTFAQLQWSRFFSKRKMPRRGGKAPQPPVELQWSRFFSKRKIPDRNSALYEFGQSFNGAAFFQSGKSSVARTLLPRIQGASMEPLFFKAENEEIAERQRELPELQWSRFFSKRKICDRKLDAAQ